MVNHFRMINEITIQFVMRDRREGDIDIVYSDCNKVINEWGWRPPRTLDDICRDAWNYVLIILKKCRKFLKCNHIIII